jgi:hypothetical protein
MLGFQTLGRVRLGGWLRAFTPTDLQTEISRSVPWRDTVPRGLTSTLGFGLGVELGGRYRLPHNQGEDRGKSVAVAWRQPQPLGQSTDGRWRFTLPRGKSMAIRWRNLQDRSASWGVSFRDTRLLEASWSMPWINTSPLDRRYAMPWRDTEPHDRRFELPYLHVSDFRRSFDIPWQGTRQPPTIWRNPNIDQPPGEPPPKEPVYIPPPGNQVDLPLECRLRDIPGDQVDLPFRRFACIRSDYVVDNTVIIKRVSDDTEVTATSVRIDGDIEAYAFGFTATLPRDDGLELIKPIDGPVEIEVTVNGQAFLCLVESWSDRSTWSTALEESITIQGRSVSAELDEPYSLPRSRAESQPASLVQLMQQELPEGGGWSLQVHESFTDYPVPGGAFSYSDLTPIRAIALIASGAGAVVLPSPDSRVLQIVPRFAGARPWRIDDAVADVEIDYGMVSGESGQWLANRETTPRLGVFVEGEKNGIAASCRLDGTAGDWAEPVVEILCTDPQAGLQRGITELGQSWIAAEIGLQLPLKTEGVDATGFIQPARVLLVTEPDQVTWKGVTTSWSIAAEWADDGLVVDQEIGVERYIEWEGA